jgi:nicotinamidase-related amidase
LSDFKKSAEEYYKNLGLCMKMGFGKKPAILVIDMQYDFVDEDAVQTVAPMILDVIPNIRELIDMGRKNNVPIIFTRGVVSPQRVDEGLWPLKSKGFSQGKIQIDGTRGAEIIDELKPGENEFVIKKRRPSAFFRTDLDLILRSMNIDTVILSGTSASGCVRATTVDGFSYGYRCMLVKGCLADRNSYSYEASLFDLNAKYADVVEMDEVVNYLNNMK